MQSTPQQTGPLRLVVMLEGGNSVLAVHCGQPVEVVFASHAPDALEDYGHGYTDLDGKPVALWMDGSEGHSAERPIVEHLFGQYCQTGSLSDLDREPMSQAITSMSRPKLNHLAELMRTDSPLDKTTRDNAAKAIETLGLLHGMLSDDEFNADLYDRIGLMLRHRGLTLDPLDFELNPEQLADKYGTATSWGEHPKFLRADWQQEVAAGDTQSGYWEWVYNRIQNGDDDE